MPEGMGMAHVTWQDGRSLCGYTGICVGYEDWVNWVIGKQCPRCLEDPDLPLLILEALP